MFERFTERGREVIVLAQQEARELGHGAIGTEHLLLGLLREDGRVATVLRGMDVTVDRVRAAVGPHARPREKEAASSQIPFTPLAKESLEVALREALSLGHNYIGSEHILLALLRGDECPARRIPLDLDVGAEELRNEVLRALSAARLSSWGADRPPRWQQDISESLEALVERLDRFVPGGALIPRRRARRLVQDAIRHHDPEAERTLGRLEWHATVEQILDANPDVEPA